MVRYFLSAILCAIGTVSSLHAHAGHDHGMAAPMAPHGGTVQETKNGIMVELLSESSQIKIYLYDHNMTPINLSTVKLSGKLVLPKKEKEATSLAFEAQKDSFTAKTLIPPKTSYYTVNLEIKVGDKSEKMSFNVESSVR